MNGRVIFLLEEPSMEILLNGLLPRIISGWEAGRHFLCVPHEGATHLERSIPLKLRNWREPGARFVVVRDNDGADCVLRKQGLAKVCAENSRPDTLIRLVCQELEAWYLGDLGALADAYARHDVSGPRYAKRYANPDAWKKPSAEIERIIPEFVKGDCARRMAGRLTTSSEQHRSGSFRAFVDGVRRLNNTMRQNASQCC